MNSRVLLRNAYSESIGRGCHGSRSRGISSMAGPKIGLSLTCVLLLSLGIWAAIWEAVAALGSAF